MDQLTIELKGEILSSNFDSWKNSLVDRIQSLNTVLNTDDDFVEAISQVKVIRAAEKYLKEAKNSALNQSLDIQRLFTAIDQISEVARQARLSLERQINIRKRELRADCIKSGIDVIRSFIEEQNNDFQVLDHGPFLNPNRFESAAKGKGGTRGVRAAIETLCTAIKNEILLKATESKINGLTIDSVDRKYRLLFQDRNTLISLSKQELELVIEKRIALFDEESARIALEETFTTPEPVDNYDRVSDLTAKTEPLEKQRFRMLIEIFSTEEEAIDLARKIRNSLDDMDSILSVKLSRTPQDNLAL